MPGQRLAFSDDEFSGRVTTGVMQTAPAERDNILWGRPEAGARQCPGGGNCGKLANGLTGTAGHQTTDTLAWRTVHFDQE